MFKGTIHNPATILYYPLLSEFIGRLYSFKSKAARYASWKPAGFAFFMVIDYLH